MNLKDFSNKHISELRKSINPEVKDSILKQGEKMAKELKENNEETYKDLEKAIDKYSSMNQNDLIEEFLKVTKEQRENGTLNENEIQNTYNMLYPLLNEDQRKNLENLMKMIK